MEKSILYRIFFFSFSLLLFLNGGVANAQSCITSSDITKTNETCPGEKDGTATIIVEGGIPNYVFELQRRVGIASYASVVFSPELPDPTHTFTGIAPGNYRIIAYDSQIDNCIPYVSSGFIIGTTGTTPSAITISGPASVCEDAGGVAYEVPLTAGSTYTWSVPSDATIVSGATGPENNRIIVDFGAASGDVTVVETNSGGCNGSKVTQFVNVQQKPEVYNLSANGATSYCQGEAGPELQLSGSQLGISYTLIRNGNASVGTVAGTGSPISFGNQNIGGSYTVMAAVDAMAACQEAMSGEVILTPLEVPEISAFDVKLISCFGGSDGAIDITVSKGLAPYTYLWNNGETIEDITGLTAGTYSVTVTDTNGCTVSQSFTLTEPAVLALDPNITPVNCKGESNGAISLTVSGGTTAYTYLWSTGATTKDISGLVAGNYEVTVTDANLCTITESFTVPEGAEILLSATVEDVKCNGVSEGVIDLLVNGGTAPYTYTWNSGQTSEDLNNVEAGTYTVAVTDSKGCTATGSYTITEPSPLVLSLSGTDATTCEGSDGTINLSASGGTGAYTFVWNNGATTEDLSDLSAGTYTVNVTDENSCVATASFTINDPAGITSLSAEATAVSCFGGNNGAIALTVIGGAAPYTYAWNNGATTEDISALSAGTYSVIVTDDKNCKATLEVVVTEPSELQLTGGATDISCAAANDGKIELTVNGGTAPYSYSWNSGQTTASISDLAAGSYTVEVTDTNGCKKSATYTINEPDALSLSVSLTDATTCGGNEGSINITVSGGTAPYTYLWNNGAATEDLSNLTAGTYKVIITDANGCILEESFEIKQPAGITSLTAITKDALCFEGNEGEINLTVNGGVAPYTYIWNNGATTEDISGLTAGTYSVSVVDANNCELSNSFTIGEPDVLSLTLSPSQVTTCGGSNGSIDLTVSGGTAAYTYAWDNGRSTEDINGLAAGTYIVTVTDANGCTATGSTTISEPSGISSLTADITAVKCFEGADGAINLTVNGGATPYTYAWNNGATTEDISGLTAGSYELTVTDANGCSASQTFAVSEPATAVSLASADITGVNCAGENTGAIDISISGGTAPYTYAWNNGATTEDITALTAGTYNVVVTDANGCTLNESYVVPAGIEITLSADVQDVNCNGGSNGSINLEVTGGSAPFTFAWNYGATTEDISNLAAGSYSVTVTDKNNCSASATFAVAEPAILNLTLDPANVSSCGGNDGAVNLTVSGGSSTYTYAWNNGATTEDISGLTAGTYTVVVRDANGCEANGSISISEPTGITALTADLQQVDCKGGSNGAINLSVEGGAGEFTFLWNNGATTEDISGLSAGTYSVTVTDANGCSANESFTITEPANGLSLTYDATNPNCAGETTGAIDIAVSGGTTPYTYTWNDKGGSTTEDLANLAAGTYTVIVTDSIGCSISQTVEIVSPAALEATLNASNVSTCGAADGSVNLEVSGGTAPYTYLWDNGATTQDISNLAAGTYSVVIKDVNACELTQSVTITAPEGIDEVIIVVVDKISCVDATDGSLLAQVSGGTAPYTYVWSNGVTTESNSNLSAGTYEVTVTDASNCSQTASITFAEPQSITFQADLTAPTCEGLSNGAINVTVSGGTAPYTYSWNNGLSTEDLTNIPEGTYEITVTDANSCAQTISYTLDAPTVLNLTLTQQNATSCNSNEGSIDLSVSGGSGTYTYLWSNGATSQDLNNLSADTYTVSVTDANGCSATASATISAPAGISGLTADVQDAGCGVDNSGSIDLTVNGGIAPYTYSWNNGATSEDLSDLAAGTYEVTVTDENGCTALAAFTVGGGGDFVVDAALEQVNCAGGADGSITVREVTGGTAPYTYQWSTGATSGMIEGLSAGTYELTVSDANGCSALYIYSITEPALIQITSTQENVSCAGAEDGSITLSVSGGTGAYAYAWADGSTSANRTALAAGTYEVTVTDENACTVTASFTITEPEPISVFAKATKDESCPGVNDGSLDIRTTGGTGIMTFLWSDGATSFSRENLSPGTYSVIATDENGCSGEATFEIAPATPMVLEAAITDLSCSTEHTGAINLSVSGGVAPYTYSWSNGATTEDIASLPAGNYTLTVTDNNQCQQQATYTIESAEPIVLSAQLTDVVCASDANGAIDLTVTGGQAPYSFAWDNGATSEDMTDLTAGTYTVVVTDAAACSATAAYVINIQDNIVLNLPDEVLACAPNSVKLYTNYKAVDGYKIEWEVGIQSILEDTIIVDRTREVSVNVTNLATGCFARDATFVVISTGEITSSVEIRKNSLESCGTDPLQLEADVTNIGQNPSYEWFKNGVKLEGETSSILNLSPYADQDSISVLVDVGLECAVNNPVSNYIILSVPALGTPSVTASQETVCVGETNPLLTASGFLEGSILKWYLGSVDPANLVAENTDTYTPTVSDAGTYKYYVTQSTANCGTSEAGMTFFSISDGPGCVVDPPVCDNPPVVALGEDQFRCGPARVILDAGYDPADGYIIEWSKLVAGVEPEIIEGNTRILEVTSTADYVAKITEVATTCVNSDTVNVRIENSISNITVVVAALDEVSCGSASLRLQARMWLDGQPYDFGPTPTYTWFKGTEQVQAGGELLELAAYENGDVYRVEVSHNQSCASADQPAVISNDYTIEFPVLTAPTLATSSTVVCEGDENPILSVTEFVEGSILRWYLESVAPENMVAENTQFYRPTEREAKLHTFLVTQETPNCGISEAGSVSFTISNDPACETVEPPVCETPIVVNLGPNQFRCESGTVTLDAGYNPEDGYLIEWTKTTSEGTTAISGNTRTITVSETATYGAKVTHVATECVGIDLVEVEIANSVSGITVAIETEGGFNCEGSPVQLTAKMFLNGTPTDFGDSPVYTWTSSRDNIVYPETAEVLMLDDYREGDVITVSVAHNQTCAAADQSETITANYTIALPDPLAPSLEISKATVCLGEGNPTISVSSYTQGSILRWYKGSVAPENLVIEGVESFRPTETAAGTYTYYVTETSIRCGTSEAGNISYTISSDPNCIPDECDVNPIVGILIEPGTVVCEDITRVRLRASAVNVGDGATYTWFHNGVEKGNGTLMTHATFIGFTSDDVFQLKVKINDPAFICNGVDEITEEIRLTVEETVTPELIILGPKPVCPGATGTLQFEARGKYIDWRFHGLNAEFSWYVNDETEPRKRAFLRNPEDNSPMKFELNASEVTASTRVRVEVKQPESLTCVPDPEPAVMTVPIGETVTPTVSMSTPASGICPNTVTTFNASSTNSGTNPVYVWYVTRNGGVEAEVQRGTASSFRYEAPAAGDQVRVKVEVANANGLCLATTEAMGEPYTVVMKTEDECAGGGFNCGVFTAKLVDFTQPSCDRENGEMHYEISGGEAPYFVRYTFRDKKIEQARDEATFVLDIFEIPAGEIVRISIKDANGDSCSLENKLEMAPQITATFTKAENGDVKCFGEETGKATLNVVGNPPFQYMLSEEEGWKNMLGNRLEFNNLPAGINSILVRQNEGDECFASAEVEILSLNPRIDFTYETEPANCNDNVGKIWVNSISGGTQGPYKIKLATQTSWKDFDPAVPFEGLKRGDYIVMVSDGVCEFQKTVTVGSPGEIAILEPEILEYDCDNPEGKAGLKITIDDQLTNVTGSFEATIYYKRFVQDEFKVVTGKEALEFSKVLYVTGLEKGIYTLDVRSKKREGCPENYQQEINIDSPNMPSPISFEHHEQHILCEGQEGKIEIRNLYGDPAFPFSITVSREGQVVKDSVISQDRYARYGAEGPYTIGGLAEGIYRLTVSQQQTGCNGQLVALDSVLEIEKNNMMLAAKIGAKKESYPDRGTGSLNFTVTTNSGQPPYVSHVYLVEPLFPGQFYQSEGDTVRYDAIETTFGHTYNDMPAGVYELYVTDANGCSVMLIDTIGHDKNIFIPNIITPNGDGINERFYVRNLPDTGTRLIITNRWGKAVYSTEDYRNNWEGGDEPDGIYFYHLQVSGGERLELKGWLEIRRGSRP